MANVEHTAYTAADDFNLERAWPDTRLHSVLRLRSPARAPDERGQRTSVRSRRAVAAFAEARA